MSSPPLLRAIGRALPDKRLSQERLGELMIAAHRFGAGDARKLRVLYRRSRIEHRHSCLDDAIHPLGPYGAHLDAPAAHPCMSTSERMAVFAKEAPRLSLDACRDALSQPGAPPRDTIDHVIVTSCTGFMAPGPDVLVTRALELRPDVGRTLIGFQGCQAGLTALRLADRICRARPDTSTLVVSVELSTLHMQSEPTEDNLLANSLFADGAAAAIVSGADVPRSERALAVHDTATYLHEDSLSHMVWHVGDTGFRLELSRLLPKLVGREFVPFLDEWLSRGDDGVRDRGFWAVHPGGAAILDSLERTLQLPSEALDASKHVLARYGNMSSPTIFFVLRELMDRGLSDGPGVALAFGPGLTVEAARLESVPPTA